MDISKSAMMTNLRFCRAAHKRGLVHQIGQIGAGKAGRAARDHGKIHIIGQRNLARVHAQNFLAALARPDAARPRGGQSGPGRSSAGSSTSGRLVAAIRITPSFDSKPSISTSKRVQRLLALVVSAAEACAAMAADRVNFIDEDDAGRVLLALLEQVANAARADADEHLDEVRTGNREERNVRFAGNGARQQGLARSRRPDEQHALRNASAELLEFLRILQEVDDLVKLFLGFVDSGHVLERGLLLLRGQQTRARLAEAQRLVSAGLHLPHHENPERRPAG